MSAHSPHPQTMLPRAETVFCVVYFVVIIQFLSIYGWTIAITGAGLFALLLYGIYGLYIRWPSSDSSRKMKLILSVAAYLAFVGLFVVYLFASPNCIGIRVAKSVNSKLSRNADLRDVKVDFTPDGRKQAATLRIGGVVENENDIFAIRRALEPYNLQGSRVYVLWHLWIAEKGLRYTGESSDLW